MVQPVKQFARTLATLADSDHCLFSLNDLRSVVSGQSREAFTAMVSRARREGLLERVCRGIYLYPPAYVSDGLILFHTARKLRADHFNYISLETALSDAGVVSQLLQGWITIMSSGRSNRVDCGRHGTIEFIHTKKRPNDLAERLSYDARCHLWRASVGLAIDDMRDARRDLDLIEWEAIHEPV